MKVALIIVTLNRKQLLHRLLSAVENQTVRPHTIVIVDNGSIDSTLEFLYSYRRNCEKFPIIILEQTNVGCSGGFYKGISEILDKDFEYVWLMDDDGFPHENSLNTLLSEAYCNKNRIYASVCVSDVDLDTLSFPYNDSKHIFKNYTSLKESYPLQIERWASFYNSVLIPLDSIKKLGLPKKEMFMWGDEVEYYFRFLRNDVDVLTITNSIQYHPLNRQTFLMKGNNRLLDAPIGWKFFCYYRNSYYLNRIAGARLFGISALALDIKSAFCIKSLTESLLISIYLIQAFIDGALDRYKKRVPF